MQHNERARFVWVRSLRGPAPEKWPADAPAGVMVGKVILAERELTAAEALLPLAELEARFPMPVRTREIVTRVCLT